MAVLNPQVQQVQDPNYIMWSRAIEQPKANLATADKLKGVANVIPEVAETGTLINEADVRQDVHSTLDPVVDAHIKRLSAVDATVTGQTGPMDVLTDNGKDTNDMPQNLKQVPGKVDSLIGARDNGHMSPSMFDAQIYSMAKQLRAQHPMYRDYVDEQVERATGIKPANKLVESLTQDINQAQAELKENTGKIETEFMSAAGLPGVNNAYSAWKAGKATDDQARMAIMNGRSFKQGQELAELNLRVAKARDEFTTEQTKKYAADTGANYVTHDLATMAIPFGNAGGTQNAAEFEQGIRTGTGARPTEEQANSISQGIAAQRAQAEAYLRNKFTTEIDPKTHSTVLKDLGPAGMNSLIEDSLKPYDSVLNLMQNEHYGYVGDAARTMKEHADNSVLALSQGPVGEKLARANGVANLLGKDSPLIQTVIGPLVQDLQPQLQSYINGEYNKAVLPNPGENPGAAASVTQSQKAFAASGRVDPTQTAQYYLNFFKGLTDTMTNKRTPEVMRSNTTGFLYNPVNKPLLDQFVPDSIDKYGNVTKGANSLFAGLTTQQAVDTVKNKTPDQWKDFQNTVGFWANGLIGKSVQDLNKVQNVPGAISYDTTSHTFVVHSVKGDKTQPISIGDVNPYEDSTVRATRQSVMNLNTTIQAYDNIARATGQDLDSFTMKALHDAGASEGVTKMIVDAMKAAKQS